MERVYFLLYYFSCFAGEGSPRNGEDTGEGWAASLRWVCSVRGLSCYVCSIFLDARGGHLIGPGRWSGAFRSPQHHVAAGTAARFSNAAAETSGFRRGVSSARSLWDVGDLAGARA